ncbi:hypothetical protein [Nocardia sp. alder85J]|uniref:hypothetical protein n=1 Tax=Nocardia sp. alder85J TaxID=2862949 RepID=UPI001CD3E80B|nr:hypothetical protein [Nocardia sp. alder85J]MCX4098305.1 hypothetical protein [Nocardia sp. alder85J]
MTTPTPRPPVPGPAGPRPGAPLPGQHLQGGNPAEFADPERVRAEIDALLAELSARSAADHAPGEPPSGTDITRRARILEQAHEVLVQALATVDKV